MSDSKFVSLPKGLIPPQSIEIECAVLGAIIVDSVGLQDCLEIINTSEVFYKESHKFIFEAVLSLNAVGAAVDLLTVSQQLKSQGKLEAVGGQVYLIQLTQRVSSSAHIEYHSRILLQYYIKRQIIRMNAETSAMAYDEGVDSLELFSGFQTMFDRISDVFSNGRKTMSFSQSLVDLKNRIQFLSTSDGEQKLVGVDTGFKKINKFTGGYREQDLVIVAARPGMGKTAYVLKKVVANAKAGVPVGVISLEMSVEQLTARIVAIDTNFHLGQLVKTGFEKSEYFQTYTIHQERMNNYPIYIDDSGVTDLSAVVLKAKQWKRKYGIKMLVIDYLQLMTDRNVKGNRETEISSISRRLKALAKELQIPVIALSQLSRAVETRGSSKRPMLADLRESGSIEQDADIVQFIYRPGYYGIEIDADDYQEQKHKVSIAAGGNTEIIFAKYRGGSLGTAILKWIGDKTKFTDPDDEMEVTEYIDNYNLPKINPADAFGGIGVENNDNDMPF